MDPGLFSLTGVLILAIGGQTWSLLRQLARLDRKIDDRFDRLQEKLDELRNYTIDGFDRILEKHDRFLEKHDELRNYTISEFSALRVEIGARHKETLDL